jgi:hypothetical protein
VTPKPTVADDITTPDEVADALNTSLMGLAQMRYRGTGPKFMMADELEHLESDWFNERATTLKARKADDDLTPRPALPPPVETRAQRDGPPARPKLPRGAPVSVRGLALLRQRDAQE